MKIHDKQKKNILQSGAIETPFGQVFNGKTTKFIYRVNSYTLHKKLFTVVKF